MSRSFKNKKMKKIILVFILSMVYQFLYGQETAEKLNFQQKYYNQISFGYNIGNLSDESETVSGGLGFRYALGYKWKKYANFGGGIGFEFYDFKEKPLVFIPVYADIRGEFTNWKIRPFYNVEFGYGFKVKTENLDWDNKPNGIYFRPNIGWKFKKNENFATTIALGYQLQKAKYIKDYSWEDNKYIQEYNYTYQRYTIQFGFEF